MRNPLKKHPVGSFFTALALLATCALSAAQAHASQLMVYNFGTSTTTYSLGASAIADHLTSVNIWSTAGFIDLARSGANLGGSGANALGLSRNIAGAATMAHSAAEAESKNRWIAFMVTPETGYTLSLESLSFYANIGSALNSANNVAVAVRVGDASNPYTIMDSVLLDNVGSTGNGKKYTVSLAGLTNIEESVSIRLLFYSDESSSLTWSDFTRIDDIALEGSVAAIPEASAAALLMAAGACALVLRKRAQTPAR